MKLWDKGTPLDQKVEQFTVGKDRQLDLHLAKYDVLGSVAHAKMLNKIKILTDDELKQVEAELKKIYSSIEAGSFVIQNECEDVHSQIEILLIKSLGDVGKKIHTARSRNDQVLLDLKLFTRNEIQEITQLVQELFNELVSLSKKHKDDLLPGYTHLQVAMPSSFGIFFSGYAETLVDDLTSLAATHTIVNQNPLGSAAGFGTSFPIDRQYTTKLLGFVDQTYAVTAAQLGRGKMEYNVASSLATIALTIGKLAMDLSLYSSQNFGFVSLAESFTTGSSIMPHKKNPDVLELIRAKCNKLAALPNEMQLISANLPSGYHRDFQILKESFLPAFGEIKACLAMMHLVLKNITIHKDILNDPKYDHIFSVEEVNKLVQKGLPFRNAYQQVAAEIQNGKFTTDKKLKHTHDGSIGNLCLDKIKDKMDRILAHFHFERWQDVEKTLIQ